MLHVTFHIGCTYVYTLSLSLSNYKIEHYTMMGSLSTGVCFPVLIICSSGCGSSICCWVLIYFLSLSFFFFFFEGHIIWDRL